MEPIETTICEDIVEEPVSSVETEEIHVVESIPSLICDTEKESTPICVQIVSTDINDCGPYKIVKGGTKRGADKLFDKFGYSYTVKKTNMTGTTWRCSKRGKIPCPVTVIQKNESLSNQKFEHNHDPVSGEEEDTIFSRKIKDIVKSDHHTSAMSIIKKECVSVYSKLKSDSLKAKTLERQANRYRQASRPERPKKPSGTHFDFDTDHFPDQYLIRDISENKARHLIFATETQLNLLRESQSWYLNGTSKLVEKPIVQLFSVDVFIKSCDSRKLVPTVIILMSRTKTQDYRKVFEAIAACIGFAVTKNIVLDYRAEIWQAVEDVFPNAIKKGCLYRYRQAITKKVKELGLSKKYRKPGIVYEAVRKLSALCMLPPPVMKNTFNRMFANVSDDEVLPQLFEHVKNTWIYSQNWSAENVSVYGCELGADHDAIGWMGRIDRKKVPFYELVALLHDESVQVHTILEVARNNKLVEPYEMVYVDLNNRASEVWKEFEDGLIDTDQMLDALSILFQ